MVGRTQPRQELENPRSRLGQGQPEGPGPGKSDACGRDPEEPHGGPGSPWGCGRRSRPSQVRPALDRTPGAVVSQRGLHLFVYFWLEEDG